MKEGLDGRELKPGWIRAEGTPRHTSEGTGERCLSAQVLSYSRDCRGDEHPGRRRQMELGCICRRLAGPAPAVTKGLELVAVSQTQM